MNGVDLDHPEIIFVKRLDGSGYGFFYSTPAQFDNAANGFIGPIKERIQQEAQDPTQTKINEQELCLKASLSAMAKAFDPQWDDLSGIDATRCVAASCAAFFDWSDVAPTCVVIEQVGDEILIREGFEFLEHPGYPLAVVIGSKLDGGGLCTFFDTEEEFRLLASKPPSQSIWLPQLIYRLYSKTPSVMTGVPTTGSQGGVGVECHAYALNRKGQLIERTRR